MLKKQLKNPSPRIQAIVPLRQLVIGSLWLLLLTEGEKTVANSAQADKLELAAKG